MSNTHLPTHLQNLQSELEKHDMWNWKLSLGTVAVIGIGLAVAGESYFGGAADLSASKANATAAPAPQAMPVPVAKVIKKTIPIYLDYSARTEAINNVTLQARISGHLMQQHQPDGADVAEGDLLYSIDDRDFRATLDQLKAQTDRDAAQLDYAQANLTRGNDLVKSGYVAKDNFDQRSSTLRQAEATLAMDKAAVHSAEINLDHTEIRAPFAGRLGHSLADVGTLVGPSASGLNTLVQMDPIYVTFSPSEADLAIIQKAKALGKIEAVVLLPGQTSSTHKGDVTFLDNVVDRTTGTITARATIANADFALLAGQYVSVRLRVMDQPDALLVPQVALGSSQMGKFVYVVSDKNTVDQRLVSLGAQDGPLVSVTTGVKEGDSIIVGNLQKIGPGAPVQPIAE
jgi:multidrug efflux system membrane fusion protein